MSKKLLSLLLALAVLITSVPLTGLAQGAPQDASNVQNFGSVGNLETDGAVIEKTAEETGNPNEFLITLKVQGNEITVPGNGADIVLVLDASGSIGSTNMREIREAAKDFVDQLLTEGSTNRIGVVKFASSASVVSQLTPYEAPEEGDWWWEEDKEANQTLKDRIDTVSSNGGTHTQGGLYLANQMLAESTAANKFIVLLSDGQPTYSYTPIVEGTENLTVHCDRGMFGGCRNTTWSGEENLRVTGYDYSSTVGSGSSLTFSRTVATQRCNRGERHNYNMTFSNADAAYFTKNEGETAGYTYYSIGFGVTSSTAEILKELASTGEDGQPLYYNANSDDLGKIFEGIGQSIEESVENASVTDPMGSMVDMVNPGLSLDANLANGGYWTNQGTVTYDAQTETLNWNPGKLEAGQTATLKYKVTLDVEAKGFVEGQWYDANGTTSFVYQKPGESGLSRLDFKVPQIKGSYGTYTVRGYLVDQAGNPIDAEGNIVDSPAEAAVVYGPEDVINPKNGNNQWDYGVKRLEAPNVTGYTLADSETKRVNITEELPDGIAWFAYTVNEKEFRVEHYVQNVDGSGFEKVASDTGKIHYGQTILAADKVRQDILDDGFTYSYADPRSIIYDEESDTTEKDLTLKLYYTRNDASFKVVHIFRGGPLDDPDGFEETPDPALKVGTVIDPDEFVKDTTSGDYANYTWMTGETEYVGLGRNHELLPNRDGKLVLYYEYKKIPVQVNHNYQDEPTLVEGAPWEEYLGTEIVVDEVANPVFNHNNKIYTVESIEVTTEDGVVTVTDGTFDLEKATTITINYVLAEKSARVLHYYQTEDLKGWELRYADGVDLAFEETYTAAEHPKREDTGFTYDHASPDSITYSSVNQSIDDLTINLYYVRDVEKYTVKYYFEDMENPGSYKQLSAYPDQTLDFVFGSEHSASEHQLTSVPEGYSYDASNPNSLGYRRIEWKAETPTGTELRLYYKLNRATFEVQHYYENAQGGFNSKPDSVQSNVEFVFGSTHNADSFVKTDVQGYEYDADNVNAAGYQTISWTTGNTPDGTVLKLYYTKLQKGYTVEHYFQNPDGTFSAEPSKVEPSTGSFVIKYGETKYARDYDLVAKGLLEGYTYAPGVPGAVARITFDSQNLTLKLYYVRNEKEYKVEHYTENIDGTYSLVKDAVAGDSGSITFEETILASTKVRSDIVAKGFTYDASVDGSVTAITYDSDDDTLADLTLKLYYTRDDTAFKVVHHFEGGPKNGTTETEGFTLPVGTRISADTYVNDYANYNFLSERTTDEGLDAFDRLQPNTEGVLHLYYRYDEVTLEVVHNYPTETVAEDADTYFLNTVIDRESQAGPVVFHDGVLYQVESYTITAKDGGVAVAEENGKFTLTEDTVVTYNYKVAEDGVRVEHYLANDDGSYNNDPDYATRETIQFGDTLNAADYDLKGTGVAVGYTYDPDEQLADGFETISFTGEMTEPDGSVLKLYYKRNTAEYTVEHYYQNLDGTYPTEPVTYDGQGGSFQFGDTVTDEDFHMEKPGFTYTTTEASVSSISWTEGNAPAGTVLKLYYERQETTYNVEHYFEQLGGGFALETKADEQNLRFQYGKTFLADSYVITREGYDYDADNANGVSKIEWVDDMTAPSGTTLKLYYTLKRANFDVRYYFEQADGSFAENTEEALTGNPFLFGEEHESSAYRKTFTGFTYDAENEGNITSISWTEGDAPAGTELKLYYKRNATEFTVEHYYQNVDGTFPADPVIYDDQGGSFKYGDEHSSEEFIREQNGLFYDAENENGISEIRFDGDTPSTGATLKLYYVRDAKDFTVKFFFETAGEPGQFTEDEALRLREQEFVFGTTHNAADYQGSITLPAGYEYNAAATEAKGFQSITWTGDMTEPSGNELQLYFTLKRATFEVHHYFEDENGEFVENPDFALTNQEFIFDTSHSASSYVQTVTGFSFDGTIADAQFQNISWTEGDAPTNTVLKLYYKRNIADFTVEHYFEQTNGTFARDDEIDTGSFKFGDTKTADAFIRTVTGYTYDANVEGSIGSISWIEGDQPTGTVLKLYYVRNSAAFTVEHYLEQADGTFEQFGDIDTGSFQFGDTKEAAAFIRTVTGYTYDASVEGSIGSISWTEGNAPAATVLKLYYVRNSAAFTVEHYFEQADGAFVKDDVTDTDSFKFGETKTADAFVRDEAGYTYDAENENGISSISWTEGDAPTATLLKLYYVRNAADYTVEHYFEQADGTYTLDETVDTGSFRFGDTITADAFVRTVTGYSYDAENENGISSISWTEGDAPAANVLKLYYGINEHTLTIHYLYDEDDSQAAPDYTATLKYGDSYEVASPEIDGFLVDIEVVEGTMPDEDVVVIVYYLEIEDIPSSETPLGPPPEESSEPEEPIESIPDIEPPLGPNTGSSDHNIAVLVLTSLFALGALMVVVVRRKKEEK